MADFGKAVQVLLNLEGGYVNDPDDPGGETKYGISKRSYPHIDIASMTRHQAQQIYMRDFWLPLRCQDIPDQRFAMLVFDTAVNMGIAASVKIAQQVLGAPVDGIFGPVTHSAMVSCYDYDRAAADFTLTRIRKYVSLAAAKASRQKFLMGWVHRALMVHHFPWR